jgi:hypothetical protein
VSDQPFLDADPRPLHHLPCSPYQGSALHRRLPVHLVSPAVFATPAGLYKTAEARRDLDVRIDLNRIGPTVTRTP